MVKAIYQASDGSKHGTAKEAENREELIKASEALEASVRAVQKLLGESALTADGQTLDMLRSNVYWFLVNFGGVPLLRSVNLWPHQLTVDMDTYNGAGVLVVRVYDNQRREYVAYKISDLYADERNAEAALIVALDKRLAELGDEVARLRKRAAKRKDR